MRFVNASTECFGPHAIAAMAVEVRARASYLGSRWVQAPIPDRREADT